MVVTAPDAIHHRSMLYHDLGMQKQETIILQTNGQATSRQVYQNATNISILVQNPAFNTTAIGYLKVVVHYVFSGQRSPAVGQAVSQLQIPQENPQSIRLDEKHVSETLTREQL